MSKTPKHVIELIEKASAERLSSLDLGLCGLNSVPSELVRLSDHIEKINFGANFWDGEMWEDSKNKFGLGSNSLSDLPSLNVLKKLPKLNQLCLWGAQIGMQGFRLICSLENLENLQIGHNDLNQRSYLSLRNLNKLDTLVAPGSFADILVANIAAKTPLRTLVLDASIHLSSQGIDSICGIETIQTLHVGRSRIEAHSIKNLYRLRKLEKLIIGDNDLGDQGAEYVGRIESLETLHINSNQIGSKGAEFLCKLGKLKSLHIGNNSIGPEGAHSFADTLFNLSDLDISDNFLTFNGAKTIGKIKTLTTLDISSNDINLEGAEMISHLPELTKLNISKNFIDDEGAQAISRLTKLTSLNVSKNNISPRGIKSFIRLKSLVDLNIASNRISINGAKILSEISSLRILDVAENAIRNEGALSLCKLKSLESLNVAHNGIDDGGITKLVQELKRLNYFNGRYNLTPETLEEILNDITALRQHFLVGIPQEEMVQNNLVKMVLIGNTGAGKTSLANFLIRKKIPKNHDSTHGIKCWNWTTKYKEEPLRVNIWDFGGQDYFHATHNLFLQDKTLYLLFHTNEAVHEATKKEDNQYHSVDYWLGNVRDIVQSRSHLQLRAGEAGEFTQNLQTEIEEAIPGNMVAAEMWYVQNKIDLSEHIKDWISGKNQVTRQFHFSLTEVEKLNGNVLDWKFFLEAVTQKLAEMGQGKLRKSWVTIRDEYLPNWRKETLFFTRKEFTDRCRIALQGSEYKSTGTEDEFAGLLTYLKGCGEILIFDDEPALSNRIYLSVEKLTNEMYKKVLTTKVKENGGRFKLEDINTKKGDLMPIMDILKHFGLVFLDPRDGETYIAPQFLPVDQHVNLFQKLIPLSFAIRIPDYLPRSVIVNFITTYGLEGNDAFYWRYGVFFTKNDVSCFVRIDVDKQTIYIHAEGKRKYDMYRELLQFFDQNIRPIYMKIKDKGTNKLFLKVKNVKIQGVHLLSNTTAQLSTDGVHFASIADLQEGIKAKLQKVKCASGYVDLNATLYQLLHPEGPRPRKIFLSYSHKDEEHLKDLKAHFTGPAMSGLIETWQDRAIDGGTDWDENIKTELKNADIVLLLISHHFMQSRYIWETEIPLAKDANAQIIPIFLSPVYFKENVHSIFKLQGFPRDNGGKPGFILGETWKTKHDAYTKVVEEIINMIETDETK